MFLDIVEQAPTGLADEDSAEEAAAAGSAPNGLDRARKAQQELSAALQQAGQDCSTLQSQEQAAADVLAALQAPLQAAA